MKKFLTIMTALLLTASGFLFTSCEDESGLTWGEVVNEIAPANTWYKVEKENAEGTNTLTLYMYYTASDTTPSGLRSDIEKLAAGITVVAVNSSTGTIMGLGNNKFIMKTFAKDSQETLTDDDSDTNGYAVRGNATTWAGLYVYCAKNYPGFRSTGTTTLPAPLQSSYKNTFTLLTDLTSFSWKKVLVNWLLGELTEE